MNIKTLNGAGALLACATLAATQMSASAAMIAGATALETWDFNGAGDGLTLNAGATKSSENNLALGNSNAAVKTSSNSAVVTGTLVLSGPGASSPVGSNVFKTVTGSAADGLSAGQFEISYDILGANFTNTLAQQTAGNAVPTNLGSSYWGGQMGFGFTLSTGAKTSLLRYEAATDSFFIAGVKGSTNILSGTSGILSQTVSISTLVDMDAGSISSFYKLGAGAWTQAGTTASFTETATIDGIRNQLQGQNGGAAWYAGDTVTFDNVVLSTTAVPEPSTTALLGLGGLALILRRRK